jgi:predicted transcriptional regulator
LSSGGELFSWAEYKPQKRGLQTVLNPLESEVMGIMWREKSATARTIYTLLKSKHSINRPTVTSAMNSLCKRGLLKKTISKGRGGLRYVFKVQISRGKFEREVVGKVIDSLLESYKNTAKKQMREKLKRV